MGMTNGEKLKELFPHFDVEDKTEYFGRIRNLDDHFIKADIDFWNAEYKEPTTPNDCETCIHNKGILECDMYGCKYEPTTKNDLEVDAVSRQAVLDLIADYDLSMGQVVKGIHALPSVTPQLSSELEKNSKKLEKDFGELDCISRKAVLDAIDSKAWEFCDYLISKGRNDEQKPVSHFADNLRECVSEDLPSVTPQEPTTGHWIEKDGFDGDTYYDCSECGESWTTIEGTPWDNEFKYCPNCGAKMVEPQESEDKE